MALGGVAPKPWRRRDAEEVLIGSEPSERQFSICADRLIDGAVGRGANDYEDVSFSNGRMQGGASSGRSVPIADIMTRSGLSSLEAEETASPGITGMLGLTSKARNTHSAVFAEVKVDDQLGVVRVTRVVVAVAAGRIVNPKTARSQILGGVVMGIGMALHEETLMDHRLGRPMNHNFAEYHIPAMLTSPTSR